MSTLLLRTVAGGLAGIYTFYGVTVCALLLLHLLWLAGRTPTMAIYLLWVYTYYGYLPTMGVYLLYSQCGGIPTILPVRRGAARDAQPDQ